MGGGGGGLVANLWVAKQLRTKSAANLILSHPKNLGQTDFCPASPLSSGRLVYDNWRIGYGSGRKPAGSGGTGHK
ncbi:hypothetical protein GCM10027044_18950 [Hymenobacter ruber]